MFVDARTLPEGINLDADICIIGGGAAGITLARDLAGGGRKTVLLESGGFDFSEATQDLYDGKLAGQPLHPLNMERLRFLGGSTNHWSGGCRPFDAQDFAARPYIPQSGWPIRLEALEDYYRRAQEICQLGPYTYAPGDWTSGEVRPLALAADGRFRTGIIQYSPPTRFGEVYRHDLDVAEGVAVYLHANVVDIEVSEGAREVAALRVACLDGRRFQVQARSYVLAVGGIENARLLLSANSVQKTGLGNGNDLVGRYFMDHPYIAEAATVVVGKADPGFAFYRERRIRDVPVQGYLYPSVETQQAEALPVVGIGFAPGSLPDPGGAREAVSAIYHDVAAGRWPDHLGYHLDQILRKAEAEAQEKYYQWSHTQPTVFSASCICECAPVRDSRVSLIDSVDALGMHRVKVDWKLPETFTSDLRRTLELLGQEFGRTGAGRLHVNLPEAGNAPPPSMENGYHHMGTTRMHDDSREGVVDANCRVHGIANLFVAGSSVFPTYSFDNPTMTIVALALRLSDHLKSIHSPSLPSRGVMR